MSSYDNLLGKFTPVMVFTVQQLFDLFSAGVENAETYVTQTERVLQDVANLRIRNSHTLINNSYGDEFKFLITKEFKTDYILNIWSKSDEIIEKALLKDYRPYLIDLQIHVNDVLDRYSRGYIVCSDCGTEHKREEIKKNRCSAGIYCDNCWNKKWKAIEAKETYN